MIQKIIIAALSCALLACLTVIIRSYPRLATPLSYRGDQHLIDRTVALRAKDKESDLPSATPIVMRDTSGTVCVELRTTEHAGGGSFQACYDKSGKLIREWQKGEGF